MNLLISKSKFTKEFAMNNKVKTHISFLSLWLVLCGTACTRTVVVPAPVSSPLSPSELTGSPSQQSGVYNYIWEEPMVDVVDVPPGLDPEGHYYRPAHQEVIEIRQGRWKYYEEDESK
jgi:hypothetical protein